MAQSADLDVFNKISQQMRKYRGCGNHLSPGGIFNIEHWRCGALLRKYSFHNDVVDEGKRRILNVMFNAATQLTNWYLGLVSASPSPTFSASDTYASHSGWTEFTNYSQSNRVAWGNGTVSSPSTTVTNSSPATFDITGTGTLKGVMVTSNNTKGDSTSGSNNVLWSTANFSADIPVANGDQLKVTYSLAT